MGKFPSFQKLSADTQKSLRCAAHLEKIEIPLYAVSPQTAEQAFVSDCRQHVTSQVLLVENSEPWSMAFSLADEFREFLKQESRKDRITLDADRKSLAQLMVDGFWNFFVWPPPEMRLNAKRMEPHFLRVANICRKYDMHDHLARMQHRRALFLAWDSTFDLALPLSREAVEAMRLTENGNPHAGTLALLLTELAFLESQAKNFTSAISILNEANELAVKQVGSKHLAPFFINCQLYQTYKIMGSQIGGIPYKERAQKILDSLPENEKINPAHIEETLPWACWQLQRYIGLT